MLTEEHKLKRQAIALDFLTPYIVKGDNFSSRVVTGDELWVSQATPHRSSSAWRGGTLHCQRRRRFHGDNEVKESVITCFVSQAASFYDKRKQKLVPAMTIASAMVETMSEIAYSMYIKWQYK